MLGSSPSRTTQDETDVSLSQSKRLVNSGKGHYSSWLGLTGAPLAADVRGTPRRYPNAPTSWVIAVAISRTISNHRRIGAKISRCSRAYAAVERGAVGSP